MLVRLASVVNKPDLGLLFLIAWEFLLRVQSVAVLLEVGCAAEATNLPAGRHSAVWVDTSSCLCVRLRQRKNRPLGSLLRRPCTCKKDPCVCVMHVAERLLAGRNVGDRIWQGTQAKFLKLLHNTFAQLCVQDA